MSYKKAELGKKGPPKHGVRNPNGHGDSEKNPPETKDELKKGDWKKKGNGKNGRAKKNGLPRKNGDRKIGRLKKRNWLKGKTKNVVGKSVFGKNGLKCGMNGLKTPCATIGLRCVAATILSPLMFMPAGDSRFTTRVAERRALAWRPDITEVPARGIGDESAGVRTAELRMVRGIPDAGGRGTAARGFTVEMPALNGGVRWLALADSGCGVM